MAGVRILCAIPVILLSCGDSSKPEAPAEVKPSVMVITLDTWL